jgi:hypothetical protein
MQPLIRVLAALSFLALAACNGNALVTLTATPASVTGFLTYRVKVVSVSVTDSGASVSLLPNPVTVDLAQYGSLTEVLTDGVLKRGNYTGATITVDYSGAIIVADNGTVTGQTLTPQDAAGKPMGQVTLNLTLDPSNTLGITTGGTSQLALDFRLSSSNVVNQDGTVTVTPTVVASASPIDTKTVRVRGYLKSFGTTDSTYSTGIVPADGLAAAGGGVGVAPTSSTFYEINGVPAIGTGGYTTLSGLSPGAWTVAYGSLSTTSSTVVSTSPVATSTGTTSNTTTGTSDIFGATATGTTGTTDTTATSTLVTNVSFTPTEVFAGSSVQGGGFDVISGVVTSTTGTVITIPGATWITNAGIPTYVSGTTTITLGSNTAVTTQQDPGGSSVYTLDQVSVGSTVTVFGTAASASGGNLTVDATNGRVRIGNTVATGTLNSVDTTDAWVYLTLQSLGGRQVGAFNFDNTGANPDSYNVYYSGLDLSADLPGEPLQLTGTVTPFGTDPAVNTYGAFTATSSLDSSSIVAEFVLDWGGGGTSSPFSAISSSELEVPVTTTGVRHQVTVGPLVEPQPSQVVIVPSTATTLLYSIAHASSSTVENYNTFAAFATALTSALSGNTATSITAEGLYTASGSTFTATGVIVSLVK